MRDEDFGTIRIKLEEAFANAERAIEPLLQRGHPANRLGDFIEALLCVRLPRGGCFGVYPAAAKRSYISQKPVVEQRRYPQQVFYIAQKESYGFVLYIPLFSSYGISQRILALSRGL